MSCSSEARELVTFWVAGSLAPGEAGMVSQHVAGCVECQAAATDAAMLIAGLRELHLRPDEIVAAAARELESPHLLVCPACRDEVAVLRGINADLTPMSVASGDARRWPLGLAAAVVLIVAVPVAWYAMNRPAGQRTPGAVPVVVAPASARPPVKILVEKATLTLLATETVRLRGLPNPRRALLDSLAAALEPYRRDDFVESVSRLTALREKYPDAPEIAYYLGVCLLKLDRPAEAIAPLEDSERHLIPPDEAAYYLAVARVNAGQTAAGRADLTRLCAGGSEVAARACAAAKQASAEPRR